VFITNFIIFFVSSIFISCSTYTKIQNFSLPNGLTWNSNFPSNGLVKLQITEVSNHNHESAKIFAKNQMDLLQGFANPTIDPYKGYVEIAEICTLKLDRKNEEFSYGHSHSINSHASENYIIGICSVIQKTFKVKIQILFCRNDNKLYYIKGFYLNEKDWINETPMICK
jgi:hypothetical protein